MGVQHSLWFQVPSLISGPRFFQGVPCGSVQGPVQGPVWGEGALQSCHWSCPKAYFRYCLGSYPMSWPGGIPCVDCGGGTPTYDRRTFMLRTVCPWTSLTNYCNKIQRIKNFIVVQFELFKDYPKIRQKVTFASQAKFLWYKFLILRTVDWNNVSFINF